MRRPALGAMLKAAALIAAAVALAFLSWSSCGRLRDVTERRLRAQQRGDAEELSKRVPAEAPADDSTWFRWRKGEGVVQVSGTLSDEVRAKAAPNVKWFSDGKESPSLHNGVFEAGDGLVAWRRPGGGEVVAAVLPLTRGGDADGEMTKLLWQLVVAVGASLLMAATAASLLVDSLRARKEANEKVTFVGNVTHELKVPLMPITMYAGMLAEGRGTDPDRVRRWGAVIAEQAERMDRLVSGLLELNRADAGRRRFGVRPFPAARAARKAAEAAAPRFAAHGLGVDAGAATALADEDATVQVLANLLDNAAKYAAAYGPVDLTVAAAGGRVRFEVADRGPGLSEEQLAHVFERFWRADDTLTRAIGGSGIGLSVAAELARGMGGALTARRREGGGLVFTLDLPEEIRNG